MNRLERLLLKATEKFKIQPKSLQLAFISEENGQYKAIGHLWDGKQGSMTNDDIITSWHGTQQKAIDCIYKLAEQYSNKNDVLILVQDYGEV